MYGESARMVGLRSMVLLVEHFDFMTARKSLVA